MISILIPTYNYDVSPLVAQLHKQLSTNAIVFEILIFEDGSKKFINAVSGFSSTKLIINKENLGRVKARQQLATLARYDWLLFLDADVLPQSNEFISNYLKSKILHFDAVFGGFAYYESAPKKEFMLRWKYGKTKEQVPAAVRNKTPYKVIISANYLIKKDVFNTINQQIEDTKGYGFDTYFGALLQQNKVKVLHIDNTVYHLGIEKSEVYLKKKEMAALTLLHFYNSKSYNENNSNDLLKFFLKIKRLRLVWFFSLAHTVLGAVIKRQLMSKNPSINLLQLYKISFMCSAYKKNLNV
ncbi:glycosyltransferase family 2 protein [Lacinutrix salivirga]